MGARTVTIGGRAFEVPRLRVGPYERAMTAAVEAEKIDAAADPYGLQRLNAICGAILDLLHESNPDLTLQQVKDLVPLADLADVLREVLSSAGAPRGEAVSP